jgi:hypothetical protein
MFDIVNVPINTTLNTALSVLNVPINPTLNTGLSVLNVPFTTSLIPAARVDAHATAPSPTSRRSATHAESM